MIHDLSLFTHPEALGEVRRLNEQTKIVEGLEHARARLKSTTSLDSNTLSKCNVFVRFVNDSASNDVFFQEVTRLSLDELAFCSISFEERRLKSVASRLKASDLRAYMLASGVSCLNRREVWVRLERLSRESKGKPFHDVFMMAQSVGSRGSSNATEPVEQNIENDPKPQTTAKDPSSFEFPAARLEMIGDVFGSPIAEAVRHASERVAYPELTDRVKSRFPRAGGDAIIWIELGRHVELALLAGEYVPVAKICEIFGDKITRAIEGSDLRKWERRNGLIDWTRCVRITQKVELRIGYDLNIANELFT